MDPLSYNSPLIKENFGFGLSLGNDGILRDCPLRRESSALPETNVDD
jgi:hypothetical protein